MRAVVAAVCGALLAALLSASANAADVTVELVRMGVGSHVRPGDSTGILVRLTSNMTEPVQTRVQWELRNADGDTALYARDIPLAPGSPTDRWLYGVLPMQSVSAVAALDMVTVVRVLQMEDGRPTRELAAKRIDGAMASEAPTAVEVIEGLIGVIGDGRAGLGPLAPAPGASMREAIPSMNEVTQIARGIDAGTLPDRWEGLFSYATLVWGNAPVQNLVPDQARALTDWVRRGGHLVILLPESGDPWGLLAGKGGRTALAGILPAGGVTRRDGVAVRELLPLLSKSADLRNEAARTGVWMFDPATVGNGYEAVLAMPCEVDTRTGNLNPKADTLQGAVVAVRKTVGFGAVTVVGIDADGLERRQLNADGLPQADVFWNRLLGRRADAPSPRQWQQIVADKRLETAPWDVELHGGPLIQEQIGMPGQVAIGILGLILAFGVYWLVAGPGVYYALKSMRKVQYAWLGFVAVAAVGTVIAWAVTGVDELSSGRVRHVTYLDRIESPLASAEDRAIVRAQTWFSAELPGYGPTRLQFEPGAGGAGNDCIWTWFEPPAGESTGFPDTEQYVVPLAAGADYMVPSRATSAVFSGVWMGDPIGEWDRLPTVDAASPLRQDVVWDGGTVPTVIVHGSLSHNLPGTLRDVHLVYVSPWRSPTRTLKAGDPLTIVPSDMMPNYGRMRTLQEWPPNTRLDIAAQLFGSQGEPAGRAVLANAPEDGIAAALKAKYFDEVRQDFETIVTGPFSATQRFNYLNFYSMLQPPPYLLAPGQQPSTGMGTGRDRKSIRLTRDLARGTDLGLWFTRPCIMVIGTLRDDDAGQVSAPFPVRIDDRAPASEGLTIVRVIFPLPDPLGAIAPALP